MNSPQNQLNVLRHDLLITFAEGKKVYGRIFLKPDERVIDVLNDSRQFIPIETDDGKIIAFSKNTIISVDTNEENNAGGDKGIFRGGNSLFKKKSFPAQQGQEDIPAFHPSENHNISPYATLELDEDASMVEVKQKYVKLKETALFLLSQEESLPKDFLNFLKNYSQRLEASYKEIITSPRK